MPQQLQQTGRPSAKEASASPPLVVPLLVIITFAAFAGVLWCGFVNYDDPSYITDNPHVKQGLTLDTIHWAITSRVQHLYHPLTLLSFALDAQIFGIEPAGFHLENLCLHCINVVLLYLLLRRLTGDTWRSALVAAVWAVHPLRVESVAWVTERKDVLMGFFGLICLHAYARYVETRRTKYFALVCLFLTLSLLAKPTLMVMPLLLCLLDFWPMGRTRLWHPDDRNPIQPSKKLLLEKVPLAAACVLIVAISAVPDKELAAPPNAGGALNLAQTIENAIIAYAQYALMLIDPRNLAAFYPIPRAWPLLEVIGSACFLVMLSLLAVLNIRVRPWIAMGWFWFLIVLLPVIGVAYPLAYAMGDRYTYLSHVGLLIAIAWSLPPSLANTRARQLLCGMGSAVILLGLSSVSAVNVKSWDDSLSLWRHALEVTQDNWCAEGDFALAIEADGQPEAAMPHFRAATRLNPGSAQAHFNYGGALQREGDLPDAIAEYRKALELNPRYSKAALAGGAALMSANQFAAAADVFGLAAPYDSQFVAPAHCARGADLLQHDRPAKAIDEFKKAIAAQPDYLLAHMGLGVALLKTGQAAAAVEQFQEAEKLNPNDPAIQKNLRAALDARSAR